jgi:hypothetical protein
MAYVHIWVFLAFFITYILGHILRHTFSLGKFGKHACWYIDWYATTKSDMLSFVDASSLYKFILKIVCILFSSTFIPVLRDWTDFPRQERGCLKKMYKVGQKYS